MFTTMMMNRKLLPKLQRIKDCSYWLTDIVRVRLCQSIAYCDPSEPSTISAIKPVTHKEERTVALANALSIRAMGTTGIARLKVRFDGRGESLNFQWQIEKSIFFTANRDFSPVLNRQTSYRKGWVVKFSGWDQKRRGGSTYSALKLNREFKQYMLLFNSRSSNKNSSKN